METVVDLSFPIQGRTIPVDHGFALYGALSRVCPRLHDATRVGVHRIRGKYAGGALLGLSSRSSLILRLPADQIPDYLALSGKRIDVDGHELRLGVPNPFLLKPVTTLYAHLVTTRNGQDEARFREEVTRQLERLGVKGRFIVGKRKTFTVHDKQVVGYSMLVTELTAEESIALQERGVGGRRKMGCGLFTKVR